MLLSSHRTARSRARAAAAAVALSTLAACGIIDGIIDPPPAPPPSEQGPRLEVIVRFADAGEPLGSQLASPWGTPPDTATLREPSLVIEGWLVPNAPQGGRTRTVPDDTLRVGGIILRPTRREPNALRYRLVVPTPATGFAERGFALDREPRPSDAPPIATRPGPLGAVARLDPDTVALRAGADLRLRIGPPPARPTDPQERPYERWNLAVTPPPGAAASAGYVAPITLGGTGAPPSVVVVPANLLPTSGTHFTVRLTYDAMSGPHYFAGQDRWAYLAGLRTSTALRWTVRRVEGTP